MPKIELAISKLDIAGALSIPYRVRYSQTVQEPSSVKPTLHLQRMLCLVGVGG